MYQELAQMIGCPELVIEADGNLFKIDNANTGKDDCVVKADAIQVTVLHLALLIRCIF